LQEAAARLAATPTTEAQAQVVHQHFCAVHNTRFQQNFWGPVVLAATAQRQSVECSSIQMERISEITPQQIVPGFP